jgi:hypothetical protein
MSIPLLLTLVLAPCAGLAILLLVRRLTAPGSVSECDPEWVEQFSVASYRPMLRLLSEDDYNYFASQRGVTPQEARKFRQERRRIFRSYLRNMVKDFHRLHLAARMTLIYSPQDRPDLAQSLLRHRFVFTWAVMMVEYRLALHALGMGPVDVRQLFGALESMRISVGSPNAQPAAF